MAHVVLSGLSKTFDKTTVLSSINLEIQSGEFMVLVGPSGCGKSTLLRLLAGLETPTQGMISIDDNVVNTVAPKDRDIAMVFQNYALYPHMSVYDNMAFGLKMRKTPKATIQQQVNATARLLELEALLKRKPKQLSGGQRQRVALGRAIVRQPKVFLMDEPLSNLDARLRQQMRQELAALHQRLKTTTVYVTHDQVEALTLGQRIVVLNEGVIQQVDTPTGIYQRPANQFVAQFMGHMNQLPVQQVDGQARHSALGLVGQVSTNVSELVLGYRAEDLALHRHKPEGPSFQIAVRYERSELLGAEQQAFCRLCQTETHEPLSEELVWMVRCPMEETFTHQEPLWISGSLDSQHCFDLKTTARLS